MLMYVRLHTLMTMKSWKFTIIIKKQVKIVDLSMMMY